jgi:hypothetical protein
LTIEFVSLSWPPNRRRDSTKGRQRIKAALDPWPSDARLRCAPARLPRSRRRKTTPTAT